MDFENLLVKKEKLSGQIALQPWNSKGGIPERRRDSLTTKVFA
jgi:hypothetical protein